MFKLDLCLMIMIFVNDSLFIVSHSVVQLHSDILSQKFLMISYLILLLILNHDKFFIYRNMQPADCKYLRYAQTLSVFLALVSLVSDCLNIY